ncbi:MAG: hypothetical protein IKD76_02115 [Clostridia bacterium]|nr:hypothetical protein [Clostridia bacterium]
MKKQTVVLKISSRYCGEGNSRNEEIEVSICAEKSFSVTEVKILCLAWFFIIGLRWNHNTDVYEPHLIGDHKTVPRPVPFEKRYFWLDCVELKSFKEEDVDVLVANEEPVAIMNISGERGSVIDRLYDMESLNKIFSLCYTISGLFKSEVFEEDEMISITRKDRKKWENCMENIFRDISERDYRYADGFYCATGTLCIKNERYKKLFNKLSKMSFEALRRLAEEKCIHTFNGNKESLINELLILL